MVVKVKLKRSRSWTASFVTTIETGIWRKWAPGITVHSERGMTSHTSLQHSTFKSEKQDTLWLVLFTHIRAITAHCTNKKQKKGQINHVMHLCVDNVGKLGKYGFRGTANAPKRRLDGEACSRLKPRRCRAA